jgi:hypothetical protein
LIVATHSGIATCELTKYLKNGKFLGQLKNVNLKDGEWRHDPVSTIVLLSTTNRFDPPRIGSLTKVAGPVTNRYGK